MNSERPEECLVRLSELTVRFGAFVALDRLSFQMNRGEVIGLVGPNGAGKTTLLRVLATLQPPTGGSAWIAGYDVSAHPAAVRRVIGYLPDFAGLYQDMKVREYPAFFAAANGLDAKQIAAFTARALTLCNLVDRQNDFIEQLSKGMRAKLAFAGVLAGDPPLLLLDEPMSGLDPSARKAIREIILQLRDEGRTVLISSHLLADLEQFCDRVLFLRGGQILSESVDQTPVVQLVLESEDETTPDRLRAMPGVADVQKKNDVRNGYVLVLKEGAHVPSTLAAITAAGLPVMLFAPAGHTLEDRFARAVEGRHP